MRLNLKSFLTSLSFCLDFVEIDVIGVTTYHSRRVAYISLKIAERFGFNENDIFDLFVYAILHDNGLSSESVFSKLGHTSEGDDEFVNFQSVEHLADHCEVGENNIKLIPFVESRNIVKYHHEFYDGSGFYGLKGDEIPLMAQIVCFADYTDKLLRFETPNYENRIKIRNFVAEKKGRLFSPDIVEAFLEVSFQTSFWLDLQVPFLFSALNGIVPEKMYEFPNKELLGFTDIISGIIDCKSKFTLRHSRGLSEKVSIMCDYYKISEEVKTKAVVAANLHDLGKLAVPNAILDKPGRLTSKEIETVKAHPYYTKAALCEIEGFEEIARWASNHHERLDGSGYPYGFKAEQLDFFSRLIASLDVYQALTENRPYRKQSTHSEAVEILRRMANNFKLDASIVEDIHKVFS